MATTNFKGPINSVEGFMFNGVNVTPVATRLVLAEGEGSVVKLASDVSLSSVLFGFAADNRVTHGATYIYAQIETSKNGVVGSSASWQLTVFTSGDATSSAPGGNYLPAATIDCLLVGAA